MHELIKLNKETIGSELVETVNARELHSYLEVGHDFRHWFNNRVKEYNFIENQDFVSFGKNLPKPQGGRPSVEYHITLDMAKELSMVERNEKGREARKYFIECERKLRASQTPGNYLEALKALVVKEEALALKNQENLQLADDNANLIRVNDDLTIRLDESEDWYTVKRVNILSGYLWATDKLSSIGMAVKQISIDNGLEIRKVGDSNYDKVNTYRKAAWSIFFSKTRH